jgi:hypothetical protein
MLVPENLLASFLRQRQQNPKRFRAEWQTKCKAAIRPIKRAADRNPCDCAPQHPRAIGDQQRTPYGRLPKIRAAPGRRPRPSHFGNGRIRGETAAERPQTESPATAFPSCSAPSGLFFSKLAPYIGGAGSPAMEINDRRNKPFGPGGSTRRLHPSPPCPPPQDGFRRGRTRIDEGVKGEFFPGMVPPLSGYAIVANDNYAPVAQAA